MKTFYPQYNDDDYKIELMNNYLNLMRTSFPSLDDEKLKQEFTEKIAKPYIQNSSRQKEGSGIRRIKIGRGIMNKDEPLYKTFGKFLLHLPSLKQYTLNIKFPSMASHPQFPRKKISSSLKEILTEIVEKQTLNQGLYNKLESKEKKLLDKLSYYSQINELIGSGFYDKEKEEFELLKYQVLSGNNNRSLLTKLKKMVVSYIKEEKIDKTEGEEILSYIEEILSL